MNPGKSPYFCANGCISNFSDKSGGNSSAAPNSGDTDRDILVNVQIENSNVYQNVCTCKEDNVTENTNVRLEYTDMSKSDKARDTENGYYCNKKVQTQTVYCIHGNSIRRYSTSTSISKTPSNSRELTNEVESKGEGHCHRRKRDLLYEKKAKRKLIIVSFLCLLFMIAEIVGGFLSGSLAIAVDAAHLLTDFVSFMISLISMWVGSRPASFKLLFGWYRAEIIGALISVLLIWGVTAVLCYFATIRIINGGYDLDSKYMLITAAVGVLINIIMGCTLHQHTCPRSNRVCAEMHPKQRPKENINVRAAFVHVVGDFIQSVGVFIASIIIFFNPDWKIVDPMCTFMFSILVLITTFSVISDAVIVLMEGSPRGIEYGTVLETLLSVPGVLKVHNLRIWALSLDKAALAAHIVVDVTRNKTELLRSLIEEIGKKFDFFEITFQIEDYNEVREQCMDCQDQEKGP